MDAERERQLSLARERLAARKEKRRKGLMSNKQDVIQDIKAEEIIMRNQLQSAKNGKKNKNPEVIYI